MTCFPMPYTFEAAKITAQRRYGRCAIFLEVPIAVENVSSYTEISRFGNGGVGVPDRGCGARRLLGSCSM